VKRFSSFRRMLWYQGGMGRNWEGPRVSYYRLTRLII
jgi:hypothetical protein